MNVHTSRAHQQRFKGFEKIRQSALHFFHKKSFF